MDVNAQSVQDFLISGENNPSTFRQQNVRLFPFISGHFLAAWEDNRDGNGGWYAQEFDTVGRLIGKNNPIPSNNIIQCISDGSFLVLSEKMGSYFDQQTLNVYGNYFGTSHQLMQTNLLGSAVLPWCGTGYLGIDYDCKSTSKNYLFLFRNDGHLSLSKYQAEGAEVFRLSDSLSYGRIASASALAVNAQDDYAILSCRIDRNTMKNSGVYGTFFNDRDSVLALDQPLGFPFDSSETIYSSRQQHVLKTVMLPDTAYLIFFVHADSGLVYFNKFNQSGVRLSNFRSFPIPRTNAQIPNVTNISISQIVNNNFSLLISNSEWRGNVSVTLHGLYSFNIDGNIQEFTEIDSMQHFANSDNFVKISDSTYYFGMNDGKDVYLTRNRNLSVLDSLKLNDDEIGSNEDNSIVLPAGQNQFCILWEDGIKTSGQIITFDGEKNGFPLVIGGNGIEFFSDGSSLSCWRHLSPAGEDTIGYTILGINGEMVRQGLVVAGKPITAASMISKILTDSSFVLVLQENSSNAKMLLFTKSGSLIQENSIISQENIYSLQISINDKQSFWMHYGSKVRLYSNQLNPLTDEKTLNSRIHLQANVFLSLWPEWDNILYFPTYYGTILSADGDTLQKKIYLMTNPDGYTIGKLTEGRFLLITGKNNSYYARAFTKDGVREKDSICIHRATPGSKKNPSFALNGNKICFAWSEVRNPSLGYSIYGSVMDLSTLVDVKTTPATIPIYSQLYQNYPNPFNPVTNIQFTIAGSELTILKVYDVLGREIAMFINEVKHPGTYSVQWDATSQPSGVYFYKLQDGKNIQTKKMVLIK